jgi:hypothetical protein
LKESQHQARELHLLHGENIRRLVKKKKARHFD